MRFFRILILLIPIFAFAQQKTLAKFIITDAKINKNDATDMYVKAGGYIVFYEKNDTYYMANVLKNSQSYGKIQMIDYEELEETEYDYKEDIYYLRWSYANDYDSKRGSANIKLVKIYKPQGVAFECTIIAEDLDILEYKGFLEGSLDFSRFR